MQPVHAGVLPLSSIAASTRCTASPSANDGDGSSPEAMAVRKSAAWLVKVWSQPRTWPGGHHAPTYGWAEAGVLGASVMAIEHVLSPAAIEAAPLALTAG